MEEYDLWFKDARTLEQSRVFACDEFGRPRFSRPGDRSEYARWAALEACGRARRSDGAPLSLAGKPCSEFARISAERERALGRGR